MAPPASSLSQLGAKTCGRHAGTWYLFFSWSIHCLKRASGFDCGGDRFDDYPFEFLAIPLQGAEVLMPALGVDDGRGIATTRQHGIHHEPSNQSALSVKRKCTHVVPVEVGNGTNRVLQSQVHLGLFQRFSEVVGNAVGGCHFQVVDPW